MVSLRACLILSGFALSPRVLARLRRANDVLYFVENALRAFSTKYNTSGERRRREQAIVMGIRHALKQSSRISVLWLTVPPENIHKNLLTIP
jgi:molybdopterin-guanine dinucleotide biosynthesis protein A